jgi:phosphoglycolate phosphatase
VTDLTHQRSQRLAAALVDLDGTLLDTRPGVLAALGAAFSDVTGSEDAAARCDLSLSVDAMIQSSDPSLPPSSQRALSDAFRRHYDGHHWMTANLYAGAEECLRDLRAGGLRSFVVTNKRTAVATKVLRYFGLAQYLDGIVGQDETGLPVPKAELTRRALALGALHPATTVVIGDSDQDAAAAAFWGLRFIAIRSGAGPLGHAQDGEDRVEVGNLADVAAFVLELARGGRS